MTKNQYLEMLKRHVVTKVGATHFSLGAIDTILESDASGEEKISRIKNVVQALDEFCSSIDEYA